MKADYCFKSVGLLNIIESEALNVATKVWKMPIYITINNSPHLRTYHAP